MGQQALEGDLLAFEVLELLGVLGFRPAELVATPVIGGRAMINTCG
jgi:hypothetical protein